MLIQGDAARIPLPDKSVHCVVTSPPYWGLRKYAGEQGRGLFPNLGLEKTPQEHIEHLVEIMRDVRRVLRDDGTVWLNYGDCYNDSQLLLMPHRIAIALQDDGWIIRNDLVWWKRNPMPESVAGWRWEQKKIEKSRQKNAAKQKTHPASYDNINGGSDKVEWEYGDDYILRQGSWRHTRAHEYVFQLVKGMGYYSNQEAVREIPNSDPNDKRRGLDGKTILARRQVISGGIEANHVGTNLSGRNPRSVLDVPTSPYSGAHYACVDDETEALTRTGWKKHDEIDDGELIACYTPKQDKLFWGTANIYRYEYDGEMVSIEKRETSQLLTPNHKCFIRRRKGHQGQGGWMTDTVQADKLCPAYELLLSAEFEDIGAEPIGENWAALIGWYITEGYRKHKYDVGIDQSLIANQENVETIRFLLNSVDANFTETKSKRSWRGRPADMAQFIVKGNVALRLMEIAPEKKMTSRLANLPVNEARILFDTLIDADGNIRKDGRLQFVQKNKECIDLVQLLAIRLGYKTVLSQRKEGAYALFMTNKRWLTLRCANGKHEPLPKVNYKGIVWCPSTPTGYWMARRNGKAFITGNTFPPDLIAPLIRASCPRRCCPECGQAWAPVVEKKEFPYKDTRTPGEHTTTGDGKMSGPATQKWLNENPPTIIDYRPTCSCGHEDYIPGIVLDPFVGSGTTVMVAKQLLRRGIGLDISMEYLDDQAKLRTGYSSPSNQLENLPLFENSDAS